MSKVRVHEDTKAALDELATRNESYDTIIWRLLAEAGHVSPDEDESDEDEDQGEPGLFDRFLGWLQSGEDLEEED